MAQARWDAPLLPGYRATGVGELARPLPQICANFHGVPGLAPKASPGPRPAPPPAMRARPARPWLLVSIAGHVRPVEGGARAAAASAAAAAAAPGAATAAGQGRQS
jgi:hypothetical protein